jgi:copper transport protein
MKISRLLTTFLLLLVVVAWAGVIPVQAHAMLMRSIPDANAALASAPAQIELFFSEAIAAKLSKISVMDSTGKALNPAGVKVDAANPQHLVAPLPHLADGVYMVVWSVISATDGHETTGSYPFTVGKVAAGAGMLAPASGASIAPAASAGAPPPTPIGEMITKGLLYLASAAFMGSILFTFLAWRPSLRQAQVSNEGLGAYDQLLHRLWVGALIILAVSAILRLMLEAGTAGGTLIGWPWQPAFGNILLGTRAGILGIVQLILGAILAAVILPRLGRLNLISGLGASLLLLGTFCLQCHAASEPQPFLPMLSDFIHLLGVAVWVGGLFAFLAGMWAIRCLEPEPRTRLTSFLIPHFTTLAMSSVAALTVTGIYASYLHVGDLNLLIGTSYGQALLLKLIIVAPMLAMGGINFMFTTPLMRKAAARPGGNSKLVDRFRFLLTGEAVLGCILLIWVGVFTTLPPARVASAASAAPVYNQVTRADDLSVKLSIDPFQPGINTFTVTLTSSGKPVIDAKNVSLEFTDLSGMVPAAKAPMTVQGGVYTLKGGYLGMPGKWDVKVVVVRPGKFDAYADFPLNMGPSMTQ